LLGYNGIKEMAMKKTVSRQSMEWRASVDKKTCQLARMTKDKKFDGQFFFGVKTTGVFCRPSCPSPVAKEENVVYFDNVFDAMEQGFRPCLRCRPDIDVQYYNGNVDGTSVVDNALKKIYNGYLSNHSISDLAKSLFLSDRHLRKLFVENLGIPPIKIAKYHKAIFAKKLLVYSELSVTEIAFASGFRSVRQFNDVFKNLFAMTPTRLRKNRAFENGSSGKMALSLNYEKPFHFDRMLSFMKNRAIKGVEVINCDSYSRTFRIGDAKGYFTVFDNKRKCALELDIHCDDIRSYMVIYNKVRRMFDLDCNVALISDKLGKEEILAKGMDEGQVPRLPVAFNPFEFTVRAIIGQQISVKAATTLAGRIADKTNLETDQNYPEGLDYFFPDQNELQKIDLDGIGISKTRRETIGRVIEKLVEGTLSLESNQSLEKFNEVFSSIKGIGDWTVNYVAMRGLGIIDSFPAADLGIIKALEKDGVRLSGREIREMSEKWRPYRAYAALCLWNHETARGD